MTQRNNEAAVQAAVRLMASEMGWRIFRNNIGAGKMDNGSFIRFGLANESKEMNKHIKSGDLIGIRPVFITPEHVGTVIGQFVSIECKHAGWIPHPNDEREIAQRAWADLIIELGGYAIFSKGNL